MQTEFVVLKGSKLVVHSDKCKCSKRLRDSFCAYGTNKEEILYDIPFKDLNLAIEFAPCAEKKLELFGK